MDTKKRLPEAEVEIMQAVWQLPSPVTADQVLEKVERDWGKTTLLNLMTRLCQRQVLSVKKEGRVNLYTPLVSREEYLKWESGSFLQRVCGGSVTKLVASLYDGNSITKDDLEELRRFLDERK